MAVVYHAFDTSANRPVAIKFLPPTDDEAALKRFRREASDLAAVFHPNIVDFYSLGEFQGREYIEMEFVGGGSLADFLRSNRSLSEILTMFLGICEGLEHIHNRGLVHRDIKPANVLISPDGVPKLADLGLAKRLEGRSQITQNGAIVGTCSYLAPEQLMSVEVGPRADLYALGICLFEAVAGRHPFQADNQMAMMRAHLQEKPVSASSLRPGIPRGLDSLLGRLLEKNPDNRPATAARVRSELQACLSELAVKGGPAQHSLQGRGSDLETLASLCLQGQPVGVLLLGPSEVGRSRVLGELAQHLRSQGLTVHELSPGDPLDAILQALGVKAEHPTRPASLAAALRRGLSLSPRQVLLADDFERLDSLTQGALEHLCRLSPPSGSGWIVSATQAQAYAFSHGPGCNRVELQALASEDMAALLRRELQGEPGPVLEAWLLPRAGGSPRQLKLLLLTLRSAELIEKRSDRFEVSDPARLPSNLTDSILGAIESLPEEPRTLMRTACLLEEPFSFELLCRASGLSEERCDQAAALLQEHGLLEEGRQERFRVGPHSARPRILASLSDRIRRRLHGRAAEALQELGGSVAQRGRQLALAGQAEEAAVLLLEGGGQAHEQGRLAEALQLWETAAGCLPEGDARASLPLARTLLALGRLDEAEKQLRGLEEPAARLIRVDLLMARGLLEDAYSLGKQSASTEPELALRLSEILALQGNRAEAIAALEPAVGKVGPHHRLRLARLYLAQGDAARAASTVQPLLDRPDIRGEALEVQAEALLAQGRSQAARERLQDAATQAADAGHSERQARIRLRLATLMQLDGDLKGAGAACEVATALLRPAGESPALAEALEQLGRIRQGQGDGREAARLLAEGVQVADVTGNSEAQARARLSLGRFQLEGGQAGSAVDALREAARLAESSDSRELLAETLAELSTAQRLGGGEEDGLQAAERAVEEARRSGSGGALGRALVALGEISIEKQRWKSALEALQEARGLLPSSDRPLQARMLEAFARLHEQGARQEYPGLSLAESERFRNIARGLRERDRPGTAAPVTRTLPLASSAEVTRVLRSGVRRVVPWLGGALVVAALVFLGLQAFTPKLGSIQVEADPPGATVMLAGGRYTSPCSLQLKPGEYRVKVHLHGYKPHEETVQLAAGQTFKLSTRLDPASGAVSLSSNPKGAKVFLEGKDRGITPVELKGLPPQRFTVKLVKKGYKDFKGTVEVVAGKTSNLSYALEKLPPPPPPPPPPQRYYEPEPYYPRSNGTSAGYRQPSPPPAYSPPPPPPAYYPPPPPPPTVEIRVPDTPVRVRVRMPNL